MLRSAITLLSAFSLKWEENREIGSWDENQLLSAVAVAAHQIQLSLAALCKIKKLNSELGVWCLCLCVSDIKHPWLRLGRQRRKLCKLYAHWRLCLCLKNIKEFWLCLIYGSLTQFHCSWARTWQTPATLWRPPRSLYIVEATEAGDKRDNAHTK